MFSKLKIGSKTVLLVLSLVLLAVITESIIAYYQNKESLKKTELSKLKILSDVYKQNIAFKFETIQTNLQHLKQDIPEEQIRILNQFIHTSRDTSTLWREYVKSTYFSSHPHINDYEDLFILTPKGEILYQHNQANTVGTTFRNIDHDIIDIHKPYFYINDPIWENGHFYYYISLPFTKQNKEPLAILLTKISVDKIILESQPKDLDEIYDEVEFLCFKSYKKEVYTLANSSTSPPHFNKDFSQQVTTNDPIDLVTNGYSGMGSFKLNQEEYLGNWSYLKEYGFGLLIQIKSKIVYHQLDGFSLFTIIIGLAILFVSLIVSLYFSRIISIPMLKLRKVLGLISNGVLPKEIYNESEDEIGSMIRIVNKIVNSLKRTANFAQSIGEGDFETNFSPISSKDTLGQALVNMRESLQNADKKDMVRNWIVSGIAEISEILRDNDQLTQLGDKIIEYVCNRTNAAQGAFYIIHQEDSDSPVIKSLASYAYQKKKHLNNEFQLKQGLIGQAVAEKDLILRTEIPDNYLEITTGILGDLKPTCLLIVPLIYNQIVYGVIEIASLTKFSDDKVEFMNEVSEIIARTIFNLKINEKTRRLLEEAQTMSAELQEQQDKLQKNAIEMEKTQEKLTISNTELERQIEEVNHAQTRTQALLQNASEVITIYDQNKVVNYVSPSVEQILGYRESDLLTKSDIKHLSLESQTLFSEMFEKLLSDPTSKITITLQYYKKTGDVIWLEATGRNLLHTPAIEGIIVNYRDITERRRAEEEERKRGQMQALSENSTDLITRVSTEKQFFYINPTITTLTGKQSEDFINKSIYDLNLPASIIEKWSSLIDQVVHDSQKHSAELLFPTSEGERVMTVNAIPELNSDNEKIESVLMVSHDITEQKETENEIKNKNQKINDSINYAEMIQDAVLPSTHLLQRRLPESFIYFKPRDIVSGDFPWYYIKENEIYLAAVDCTGHGVPGALISLVGYFLLNNIMERNHALNSGELLDELDKAVTDTFRQNEESSKIKDGMDIALCKINLDNHTLEFAGANRPLYYISNNILHEIKGDKFPIGGGKSYTNKTAFTNNFIEFKSGDSFYFFSDGLPDQFGGENGTTKLGGKRIKELLLNNKEKSIFDVEQIIDTTFNNWKGDTKQTDDVLMIGLRL